MKKIKLGLLIITILLSGNLFAQEKEKEAQLKLMEEKMKQKQFVEQSKQKEKLEQLKFIQSNWSTNSSNATELSLSKNYEKETNATKNASYIVADGSYKMTLNASGYVKSGKIIITIKLPSGEEYNKIELDNSADLKWAQSISLAKRGIGIPGGGVILNKENKEYEKYIGKWAIEIKAEKVVGYYKFKISSY